MTMLRRQVLLLAMETEICAAVRRALPPAHFDIARAPDRLTALAWRYERRFDLYVVAPASLDTALLGADSDAPVIVLSAAADTARAAFEAAGADAILALPIDERRLAKLAQRLTDPALIEPPIFNQVQDENQGDEPGDYSDGGHVLPDEKQSKTAY